MTANKVKPRAMAYALVRDATGKPKIDGDPRELPDQIKAMMTDEEMVVAVVEYVEEKANGNA